METTPDTEALQKDKDLKAKMKAYADQKRQVKPDNLNAGDITLVKQRRPAHISNLYHTQSWILKLPWSPTDEQLIKKKAPAIAPISRNLLDTEPEPADEKVSLNFEEPEVCQPAPISGPQGKSSQAHPSKTNVNQDNTTLVAAGHSTPSPLVSSCSGRLIKKPGWMKDCYDLKNSADSENVCSQVDMFT